MEEQEVKKEAKKRLTPESTILLTIGAIALVIVVVGVIHFILHAF